MHSLRHEEQRPETRLFIVAPLLDDTGTLHCYVVQTFNRCGEPVRLAVECDDMDSPEQRVMRGQVLQICFRRG